MTLALFSPQVTELLDQGMGVRFQVGKGSLSSSPTPPAVSMATGEEVPVSSGAGWTVTVILLGTSLSRVLFFEVRVHLFGSSAAGPVRVPTWSRLSWEELLFLSPAPEQGVVMFLCNFTKWELTAVWKKHVAPDEDSCLLGIKSVMCWHLMGKETGPTSCTSLLCFRDLIKVLKWYVDRVMEAERQEHIQDVLKVPANGVAWRCWASRFPCLDTALTRASSGSSVAWRLLQGPWRGEGARQSHPPEPAWARSSLLRAPGPLKWRLGVAGGSV